ncbi:hypothetical protein GGG16DRAFT_115418 [Schizophyllum commune]
MAPGSRTGLKCQIVFEGPHAGIYVDKNCVPEGVYSESCDTIADAIYLWQERCVQNHTHSFLPFLVGDEATIPNYAEWRLGRNKKSAFPVRVNTRELYGRLLELQRSGEEESLKARAAQAARQAHEAKQREAEEGQHKAEEGQREVEGARREKEVRWLGDERAQHADEVKLREGEEQPRAPKKSPFVHLGSRYRTGWNPPDPFGDELAAPMQDRSVSPTPPPSASTPAPASKPRRSSRSPVKSAPREPSPVKQRPASPISLGSSSEEDTLRLTAEASAPRRRAPGAKPAAKSARTAPRPLQLSISASSGRMSVSANATAERNPSRARSTSPSKATGYAATSSPVVARAVALSSARSNPPSPSPSVISLDYAASSELPASPADSRKRWVVVCMSDGSKRTYMRQNLAEQRLQELEEQGLDAYVEVAESLNAWRSILERN